MGDLQEFISTKSTQCLEAYLNDESLTELKASIARELIKRSDVEKTHVNQRVVYECMNYLLLEEILDLTGSKNACVAYLANRNLSDRLSCTKNRRYFDDGRIRALKKTRMNKRGKVLTYDY